MSNQKSKTFKPREESNHKLNVTRTKMENRQTNTAKYQKSNKNSKLGSKKLKTPNHKQTNNLTIKKKKHKFTNLA